MSHDLTNLRAECERALALAKLVNDSGGLTVPYWQYRTAIAMFDIHAGVHSPRASRALLIAVDHLTPLAKKRLDWAQSALRAMAAEFAGEKGK